MRYSNGDREHVPSPETEAAEKTQSIGAEPHLGWAAGSTAAPKATAPASTASLPGSQAPWVHPDDAEEDRLRRELVDRLLSLRCREPERCRDGHCRRNATCRKAAETGGWRNGAHMTRRELSLPQIHRPAPSPRAEGKRPRMWARIGSQVSGAAILRYDTNRQPHRDTHMSKPQTALSAIEIDRYKRHLVLKEIGGQGQQELKAARVLVVGAGGLGSPLDVPRRGGHGVHRHRRRRYCEPRQPATADRARHAAGRRASKVASAAEDGGAAQPARGRWSRTRRASMPATLWS